MVLSKTVPVHLTVAVCVRAARAQPSGGHYFNTHHRVSKQMHKRECKRDYEMVACFTVNVYCALDFWNLTTSKVDIRNNVRILNGITYHEKMQTFASEAS